MQQADSETTMLPSLNSMRTGERERGIDSKINVLHADRKKLIQNYQYVINIGQR